MKILKRILRGMRHWKRLFHLLWHSDQSPIIKICLIVVSFTYLITSPAWLRIFKGVHPFYYEDKQEGIKSRFHRDYYELVWLIRSITLAVLAAMFSQLNKFSIIHIVIFCIVLWRLIDIYQNIFRIVLFDRLRIKAVFEKKEIGMLSPERRVIFAAINYFELCFLFSCFYSSLPYVKPAHGISFWEAIYFSVITMTTLGYGDIQPAGITRAVASIQAITGIFFMVMIMGYLIALLRHPPSLSSEKNKQNDDVIS